MKARPFVLKVRMSEQELALLDDICNMVGLERSEVTRTAIVLLHVLSKSGLHQFLKPLPELAKIVESSHR